MAKKDWKEDPKAPWQFTGWWIPREVVYLFEDRKINAKEVLLLSAIHSLHVHGTKGCIASNQFLAEKMSVNSITSITTMLRKLKKLGLIKVSQPKGGLRRIKTTYDRPRK